MRGTERVSRGSLEVWFSVIRGQPTAELLGLNKEVTEAQRMSSSQGCMSVHGSGIIHG
jgi:hypothetical protein